MKSMMRTLPVVALVGLTTVWIWAAQGSSLDVVVTYESGEITAGTLIHLMVHSEPYGPEVVPHIAHQVITKDGETASFSNLTESPVYVSAVYDDLGRGEEELRQGNFSGLAVHGIQSIMLIPPFWRPTPIELTEGETRTVRLSFDDADRMP